MANYGGRVPRAFSGIETTVRNFEQRITTLERIRATILADTDGGNDLLSGIGPPTLFIGNYGDFYIDYQNWVLYGPKMVVGGWSNQIVLGGTLPRRRMVSFGGGGLIDSGEHRYDMAILNRTERVLRVWSRGELFDSKPARIRAYSSAAYRAADLDRDPMVDPVTTFTGLLFETIGEKVDMSPVPYIYAKDDYGGWFGSPEFELGDDVILQPIYFTTTSYSTISEDLVFTTMTVVRAE